MSVNINPNVQTIDDVRHALQGIVRYLNELESANTGQGASKIVIEDSASNFDDDNVEDAIRVLQDNIEDHVGSWHSGVTP